MNRRVHQGRLWRGGRGVGCAWVRIAETHESIELASLEALLDQSARQHRATLAWLLKVRAAASSRSARESVTLGIARGFLAHLSATKAGPANLQRNLG